MIVESKGDSITMDRAEPRTTEVPPAAVGGIPPPCRAPRGRECLICYVYRMWREHGCGEGLSLVRLYRDSSSRVDATLEKRLDEAGVLTASDLVFTAHHPNPRYWNPGGAGYAGTADDGTPGCLLVVRGPTAAYHLWRRTSTWQVSGAGERLTLWA